MGDGVVQLVCKAQLKCQNFHVQTSEHWIGISGYDNKMLITLI